MNTSAHVVKAGDAVVTAQLANELQEKLQINNTQDLEIDASVKSSGSYDKGSGVNVVPVTDSPMVSFHLDIPYHQWTDDLQTSFLNDVAQKMNVSPSDLFVFAVSEGSTHLNVLCNVVAEQFPNVTKVVASGDLQQSLPKKWKMQSVDEIGNFLQGHGSNSNTNTKEAGSASTTINTSNMTAGQQCIVSQTQSLRASITNALQNCGKEYQIAAICLLDDPKRTQEFTQIPGYQNSKILFHGTKYKNLGSIFKGGFDDKYIGTSTDAGWYGRGHYFSSFPEYCMALYAEKNEAAQMVVIVSMVNCGKIAEVRSRCVGQPLPDGIDCHYVQVLTNGHPSGVKVDTDDIFDEYVIKTGKRVLPRFYVLFKQVYNIVLWRDAKLSNIENSGILNKLKKSCVVYGAESTAKCIDVIRCKKKTKKNKIFVITNGGDDGEGFVRRIREELKVQDEILVFCSAVDWHSQWAAKYDNVRVTGNSAAVQEFVNAHTK